MDTGGALSAFAQYQQRRNLAPATIDKYAATLRGFFATLNGHGITGATGEDVEAFLATRHIGPRGRYHYISHISNFYQWAMDEGLVERDPTRRVPRPQLEEKLPRPVTDDELETGLAHAGPRMHAWIALGAYAGLRCQEIARLRAEDLSWERRMLTVSSPKGRRERAVPIHAMVEKSLRDYGLPPHGFVFRRWDSRHAIGPASVSDAIADHFRSLDIKAVAHQLRHWFASTLYGLTGDIRLVQEMLGHRDLKNTMIYTKLHPKAAIEGVNQLPGFA